MDFRAERVNDNRHQRRRGRNRRREKIDEARRFVRNDVFFENKLKKIGKRLQQSTGPYAIRPEPALDKPEHTTLCQNRVRHHSHHDGEGDEDADKQQGCVL